MPWVRIDENAIDHPKFIAISANAWRLWCEGQCYCQKHLTDGLIPTQVLKGFRYYSPASLKMLGTALVPGKAPLWHVSTSGVSVHDYLDWNDSREMVMKARAEAKDRKRRWRDGHVSVAGSSASGNAFPPTERTASGTPTSLRGVVCREKPLGGESAREGSADPADVLAERAGRFLDRYRDLYEKYRKGAKYIGKPNLDYLEAVELARVWDDDRLDKIATVFLTTDHRFAEEGSRTVPQLRALASWCDSKLRDAGL